MKIMYATHKITRKTLFTRNNEEKGPKKNLRKKAKKGHTTVCNKSVW